MPVLADVTINGQPRKVVMQANRNGFLYVLDRTNGKFINAQGLRQSELGDGLDARRPSDRDPGHVPTEMAPMTCPDWYGSTNFMSPSFDHQRGLFFLTVRETCASFIKRATPDANVGDRTMGGTVRRWTTPRTGALRAIDPLTGERKWEVKYDGRAGPA